MKLVRLTEGDLHRIVKESVNRILRETTYYVPSHDDPIWDEYVGMPYEDLPWFMKKEEIEELEKNGEKVVCLDDEEY